VRSIRPTIGICAAAAVATAFLCAGDAYSADGPSVKSEGTGDGVPELVVTGEQPGPGLWKVSKGDHVLWVLGTISALPKRMKWLKSSIERKPRDPCWEGFREVSFVKDLGVQDIEASIHDAWLKAAEKALSENGQSFAVLKMSDVLLPSGLLAMLKARGYAVLGLAETTDAAR